MIRSDTGLMGRRVAHEFTCLFDAGEDTVALCEACGAAQVSARRPVHDECLILIQSDVNDVVIFTTYALGPEKLHAAPGLHTFRGPASNDDFIPSS